MVPWFHDAIYDTKSKNNEKESAELSYRILKDSGLKDCFGKKVYGLILATKHQTMPKEIDAQAIVDIDLSILGKPTEEFEEYEKNIRKEYWWVSKKKFKAGRNSILKTFLSRPNIYSTDFFRNKYENQARINLERTLAKLR